jgi:hypothetical protein
LSSFAQRRYFEVLFTCSARASNDSRIQLESVLSSDAAAFSTARRSSLLKRTPVIFPFISEDDNFGRPVFFIFVKQKVLDLILVFVKHKVKQ